MSLSNKEFKRNVGKLDGIRGTKIKEHQENEYACEQIRCPGTAFMEKNDVFGYYDNACDRARIRFEYGEKNDEEICI